MNTQRPWREGPYAFGEAVIPAPAGVSGGGRTEASAVFAPAASSGEEGINQQRVEEGDRLLRRTNHLLRWYRAASGQAQVSELSRALASPFRFTVEGTDAPWAEPLEYEAGRVQLPANVPGMHRAVLDGLASKKDPPVSTLSLLDAEYAMKTGRFRETVLFCWSAIDATFGRKYDALVDDALAGEWAEARKFFRSHIEIPMRQRMTAMMHLMANRSLYREPGLWNDLSASYDHRNNIIHRGDNATERHAELARIIHASR